ncbi:MAG: D-2-hydroxyacid dehydrogenase [Tissierellia bacterium]|nr:D-2-hydroxyacid dehydrogenase [Tissierellia bacterium]
MKALIVDDMSTVIDEELKKRGIEVDKEMLPTAERLAEIIEPYDLLIMRVDPFIDKKVIDAGKNLKGIFVGSTGTNHIDLEYAKEKNIPVRNSPGQNANAVAELVFCKALDLYRNSVQANNEVKYDNIWNKYRWKGRELRNKTLGIIGFGAIGRRVAEIAHVFHMDIIAYDPFVKPEDNKIDYVKIVSLDEIIENSDIITLHVPLTKDTKNMISDEEMERMKDGACIINCARGGTVDEEALYKYIKNGKLGGANLDCLADELGSGGLDTQDVPIESPLFELDRVYVSPHIGGSTQDAQDDIGHVVINNVIDVLGLEK